MSSLKPRDYLLSVQHLFAMFGATVLVPLLTGINPSLALFTAGIGTLMFHVLHEAQGTGIPRIVVRVHARDYGGYDVGRRR